MVEENIKVIYIWSGGVVNNSGIWHSRHMLGGGMVVAVDCRSCRNYMGVNCSFAGISGGVQHCCGCSMRGMNGNRGCVRSGGVIIAMHCC